MPEVPQYGGPKVASQPLSRQRLDENATAASSAGVHQLSRGLQDVSDVMRQVQEKERDDADTAALLEADTSLDGWESANVLDAENGAYTKKGEAAFDLPNQVLPNYDSEAKRIEGSLGSDRAKLAFRMQAQRRRQHIAQGLERHEFGERQNFYDEQSAAKLRSSAEMAGNYYNNPERIAEELGKQDAVIDSLGARKGWSAEQVSEEKRKNRSNVYADVVTRHLARGEVRKGEVFFEEVRDQIGSDAAVRIEGAITSERRRLEAEARARQAEQRESLRLDLGDAFAARAIGIPAQLPDVTRFTAAFGQDGAKEHERAQNRWKVYDVVAAAAFQPQAEAAATIAKLRPTTQDGAAAGAQDYRLGVDLYQEQRRQLEADPVAVLTQRDPELQAMQERAAEDSANLPAYLSMLRAKQEVLGVEKPKLLPAAQRDSIAAQIAEFDPEAPLKRVQSIARLRQAFGRDFSAVMQEVAPKLDGQSRVLIEMAPKDAERLDAAYAQRDTYKDTVPQKARTEIKAALQTELADFSATLFDNPDGEARIAEHFEAAELLAQSLVLRSTTPIEAARQAAAAVVNGQYTYHGTLRVPKDFNDSHIVSALDATRTKLAKSGEFLVTANAHSTSERAQEDMRALVARQGYWVTNEDGSGAVLRVPHRSGLGEVYSVNGERVEVSFEKLAGLDVSGNPLDVDPWSGY